MEKHRTVSISLAPNIISIIEKRAGIKSKSNCISFDLAVFWNVLDRGLRELEQSFSRSEMTLIKDAIDLQDVNESQIEMLLAGALSLMVTDGINNKDLANAHGVDGPTLIKKVEEMSDFARLSCIDLCTQIWRTNDEDLLSKFKD
jgi:hypothetical protein